MSGRVAGIELGGTKSVAVLAQHGVIVDRLRVPTTLPEATLTALADRVAAWHSAEPLDAIGIASFGPVMLDPGDPAFGFITGTPKPHWSNTDVRGHFVRAFAIPIGFDTDVGGAALAEGRSGAAHGCSDHIYLTIGTGLGAGIVAGHRLVHGSGHPEFGHIRVRRVPGDPFTGACPFHGDCLEGLVAGPALAARTGIAGDAIPGDHPVWNNVAVELAEAMAFLLTTLAPQRIVIGGGVAAGRPELLAAVHTRTSALIGGYLPNCSLADLARVIVAAELGDDAGPLGAVELGLTALGTRSHGRSTVSGLSSSSQM